MNRDEGNCVWLSALPISRLGFKETMAVIRNWLGDHKGARQIATANADFLRISRIDLEFSRALKGADLITADGIAVSLLAKVQGRPVNGRVSGSDLVPELLRVCAEDGRRVFFLGGAEGAAKLTIERVSCQLPNLLIAGVDSRYVDLNDDSAMDKLLTKIRLAKPDLLLVGLGAPKQEIFLSTYLEQTGARVGIGIGGTFDFLSGRLKRAPLLFRKLGIEWLFRLTLEPKRLLPRYFKDVLVMPRAIVAAMTTRLRNGIYGA